MSKSPLSQTAAPADSHRIRESAGTAQECSRSAQCRAGGGTCRSDTDTREEQTHLLGGPIARRPWIWIVLGYIFFLGVMFAFVWIAKTHADPSVPITHQNNRNGAHPRAAEEAGAAQTPRSTVTAPVTSASESSAEASRKAL